VLAREGYSPLFLNASKVKLISGFETPMQGCDLMQARSNSLNPFSSVVVTEGREQLIPVLRHIINIASIQALP
jgi:hypothetical protein